MKVVANSSVLIGLSAIGRLNLLKQRFPEGLLVPEAVRREVVHEGAGRPGAGEVASAQWITVQAVRHRAVLALFSAPASEREKARQALRAAGLLIELSPGLRAQIDRTVRLEDVESSLARAGGKSLSEIVLEQRGPKG